jgi:hypothetical protein
MGFHVESNGKKVPVYTMLFIIEEYTGKMTAYPDIAYLHRGSGYDKRHAGSFKGKKIKQSFLGLPTALF